MWPVIRRTSVPPTEMSKDHRPHQALPPAVLPPRVPPVGAPQLGAAHRTKHNFTAWTHICSPPSGVPRRWHRRCLTDRHRQRWSDDRRIPPPGARHVVHRTPGRSPVRRRTRAAQAPANGAGSFERNGPAPQSLFPSFRFEASAAGNLADFDQRPHHCVGRAPNRVTRRSSLIRPCVGLRRPRPPQEYPACCIQWPYWCCSRRLTS